MARLPHNPALDGLRGAAVAAVVAFHLGWIDGGWLGVDTFFVLSGFLIGSLLLAEASATGRVRLGAFWLRRARRLLPALLVLCAVVGVYAAFVAPRIEQGEVRADALATVLYVANWRSIAAGNDYWDQFRAPSPLEHTWSLAIEEQAYVLLPLLVLAVAWATGRRGAPARPTGSSLTRAVLVVAVAGAFASAATMALLHTAGSGPDRTYLGTDTRLSTVFAGVGVAALAARGRTAGRRWALPVSVAAAAVVTAWLFTDGRWHWPYEWGIAAHTALVALTVSHLASPDASLLRTALAWAPLRLLGRVSYGLYLWHWPMVVWLTPERTGLDDLALDALVVAASSAATALSFHLVEAPVRFGGLRDHVVALGAPLATAALVVLLVLVPSPDPDDPGGHAAAGGVPAPAVPVPDATSTLVVLGDSGAAFLGPALAEAGRDRKLAVVAAGTVGCGVMTAGGGVEADDGRTYPDPPGCEDWRDRWTTAARANGADAAVVVLSWPGIGRRRLAEDGPLLGPCDDTFGAAYEDALDAGFAALVGAGVERLAVATASPPAASADDPAARRLADCLNDSYRAAARRAGATIVDLDGWLCPEGRCREELDDGTPLRPDGLHYEGVTAAAAAEVILDRLAGPPGP